MRSELAGRRAVVTGAASGIGAAVVQHLRDAQAAVVGLDISYPADSIEPQQIRCDVASLESCENAFAAANANLGGIDTVVVCAGVTHAALTHELSAQSWKTLLDVNLTGCFYTLRVGIPYLLDNGGGAIVTIGSAGSLVAAGRSAAYDATKGGVLQLTRGVAADYADANIRANCVCPGRIDTPFASNSATMHGLAPQDLVRTVRTAPPFGRAGTSDEVASAVAFLVSEDASFITGTALPVDGGFTAV